MLREIRILVENLKASFLIRNRRAGLTHCTCQGGIMQALCGDVNNHIFDAFYIILTSALNPYSYMYDCISDLIYSRFIKFFKDSGFCTTVEEAQAADDFIGCNSSNICRLPFKQFFGKFKRSEETVSCDINSGLYREKAQQSFRSISSLCRRRAS